MPHEESNYPRDWQRIAEKDLARTELLLKNHDPEAAGFYLQQAVEKFLKAFLLAKGWRLARIHDLETLLNEALPYLPSMETFRPVCQKITAFYFVERYPFIAEAGLTEEEVGASRRQVSGLIERLRTGSGDAGAAPQT